MKNWGRIHKYLYNRKMWIRLKRKFPITKNISLLDRLAYCEPPPSGGKQCGSLSNNNHGLNSAKDSSAGL